MAVDVRNAAYVPTIFLRNSELMAVSELPDSSKDVLAPIFCLKPWATAKLLERSIEKVQEAYPHRRFFLDIDPFYDKEAQRQSQVDFYQLIEDDGLNQAWIDFFEDHPLAHPCLQVNHGNIEGIRRQIEAFTAREKLFLVRLDHDNGRDFSGVIEEVCRTDHANFGFVIDAGWSRDLLGRQAWLDGLIKQIVQQRGDDIPIITSGSSFPASFSAYELGESVEMLERRLFAQLQASNNRARLVYGDWASSRSPSEGGGGVAIPPRIDLATGNSWEIYRSNDEAPNFPDLAIEAMASRNFPSGLAIWGTYMIESTALSDPNGITSLRKATAVRINMHLYRQLHFSNFLGSPDTDDDYVER